MAFNPLCIGFLEKDNTLKPIKIIISGSSSDPKFPLDYFGFNENGSFNAMKSNEFDKIQKIEKIIISKEMIETAISSINIEKFPLEQKEYLKRIFKL